MHSLPARHLFALAGPHGVPALRGGAYDSRFLPGRALTLGAGLLRRHRPVLHLLALPAGNVSVAPCPPPRSAVSQHTALAGTRTPPAPARAPCARWVARAPTRPPPAACPAPRAATPASPSKCSARRARWDSCPGPGPVRVQLGAQAGRYSNSTEQSSCAACPSGRHQSAAGQTECTDCAQGSFVDAPGQVRAHRFS
jgi:hypothetical protein